MSRLEDDNSSSSDHSDRSLACVADVSRDEDDELSSVESGDNDEDIDRIVQLTHETTLSSFPWSVSLKEEIRNQIHQPTGGFETTPSAALAEAKAEGMLKQFCDLMKQHGTAEEQKLWNEADTEQQNQWIADMFLTRNLGLNNDKQPE